MAGVIFDGKKVAPAILVEKEIEKTKFGVSIDDMLGNVDDNGIYEDDTTLFTVDLSGVKEVGPTTFNDVDYPDGTWVKATNSFAYKFYRKKNLVGTVDLSNITYGNIGEEAFGSAFEGSGIEVAYLPKNTGDYIYMQRAFANCNRLHTVYIQGADFGDKLDPYQMFEYCKNLERVYGVENIVKLELYYTFRSCEKLSGELHFDSAEAIVGNCYNGLARTKITKVFFPKLTSFSSTSCFGTRSTQYIFDGCSELVEIHFRADMQATVEALGGYSAKWGATNASIIFDL